MDETALNYEYLIRRAHKCGRYGVAGANADTFRGLEKSHYLYNSENEAISNNTERYSNHPIEHFLTEYFLKVGEVSAYIKSATSHVRKEYKSKLTSEQYNELEEVESIINHPTFEKITEAIKRAEVVMIDIGLYPV